jgi:hypothetical protein
MKRLLTPAVLIPAGLTLLLVSWVSESIFQDYYAARIERLEKSSDDDVFLMSAFLKARTFVAAETAASLGRELVLRDQIKYLPEGVERRATWEAIDKEIRQRHELEEVIGASVEASVKYLPPNLSDLDSILPNGSAEFQKRFHELLGTDQLFSEPAFRKLSDVGPHDKFVALIGEITAAGAAETERIKTRRRQWNWLFKVAYVIGSVLFIAGETSRQLFQGPSQQHGSAASAKRGRLR